MGVYDMVLPVFGPLHLPVATPGRGCSHTAPDSCPRCDGTDAERFESAAHRRDREAREITPACMIEEGSAA